MTDTTDDIAEEISFQSFDDDCKLLCSLLNDVLQREVGTKFMDKFERDRTLAQSACNLRMAGVEDTAQLLDNQLASEISNMTLEEAFTLARAFSHYLNLMGIAETHHRVRKARSVAPLSKSCDDIFNQLVQGGVTPDELYQTVCKQVLQCLLLFFLFFVFCFGFRLILSVLLFCIAVHVFRKTKKKKKKLFIDSSLGNNNVREISKILKQ